MLKHTDGWLQTLRRPQLLIEGLFFLCVTLLLFAQAMQKPLDHDEHQFVASGWLIARAGLLPYRDFPYFHLPYLSVFYAPFFLLTNHLLLVARLLSVGAALVGAWLIYHRVSESNPFIGNLASDQWREFLIGTSAVLIWLFNPISQFASGLAWNHDTAVLLCLLAFVFFTRHGAIGRHFFLSGLLLALAVGIRATFALTVAAFVPVIWFERERKEKLLAWAIGFVVGSLPNLVLFWLAPSQFIFGNISYAALNTQWRVVHEYERAMTLPGKLEYLATVVIGVSSTLVVLLAFALALWIGQRRRLPRYFWLAASLAVALFIAAFLPTPTFEQYFYSAIPFVVLTIGLAFREWRTPVGGTVIMLGLAFISLLQGWPLIGRLPILLVPVQWTPLKAHEAGGWIHERSGDGDIVTLAPIYPLEANLAIYPELATGPFAYRVGELLTAEERTAQHLFTVEDIPSVLDARHPRAIFLGFEPEELEEPFIDYARAHRYTEKKLPNGKHLWLAPN